VLATVKFNVESSGQSPLNLYSAILLNSEEEAIPSQLSGGNVYCSPSSDVAVTSVNVSPITVLPGNPVHVNATVQNLGGSAETFNVTTYANSHIIGVQKVALNSGSSQTLFFTWNTTGYSQGDYNVSAVASTVPGETNTTNNAKAAANIVTILYNGHDVTVTRVDTAKDSGRTVIGQGFSTNITATVKNYGIYTESFNTTAYLNTTPLQTKTASLESGAFTTITFTWNTAGFAYGNYTISANITLAPGRTNHWTGRFIYGIIKVTIPGDVNGDGVVNILDVQVIAAHWGQRVPPAPANADVNGDGVINILDVAVIAAHWGQKISP
jgi:predicted lipoprotein with Yx(FWY)xxD motif